MTDGHTRPAPPAVLRPAALGTGATAALVAVLAGAACLLLEPYLPWLVTWPDAWTLPMTRWIDVSLSWLLELVRPAARALSWLLAYPMDGANALLSGLPWPLVIGCVVALGWFVGGWTMAALGLGGMGFVLASGYWAEGMNTLSLVAVSVPLALMAGGALGILANEAPRLKPAIQTVMDVMQTVPTFAYLTPLLLLFGFGPVVGLIASAIYAAPPMARNVILGLERIEPDIREAAVMSGGTRLQQLFLVEIPAAKTQIMVGVNQCLMAALSMVIIAAVIGGFNDIGWEVLLTMRKAQFGQSLLAGLVIVVFAILIDRMSAGLAQDRDRHDRRVAWAVIAVAALAAAASWGRLPEPSAITLLQPAADRVDAGLSEFTVRNGAALDAVKNGAMFYALLPLRIGLDNAVLPFTWGMQWTPGMSLTLFVLAAGLGAVLARRGGITAGLSLLLIAGVIETGVAELPWPFVLAGAGAVGWAAGGRGLALFAVLMLGTILVSGL